MERDEFRDFLLQISVPRESGRTLRFSLVRLISKSISSKLTDERYISLRTVPFSDNYRFVLTSFTHSEYSKFKNDYYDQVDFLRIRPEEFRKITNTAFKHGLELDEYMSSGPGKLEIRAPTDDNRSEYLLNDMENRFHEGFKPYLLKLSGNGMKIRVRADFNFFVSNLGEKEANLIYDITDGVLRSHREYYERLAGFRSSFNVNDKPASVTFKLKEKVSADSINDNLSRKFETVVEKMGRNPSRIFLKEKQTGRWISTLCVVGNSVQAVPGLDPTLESMLIISESIEDLGAESIWQ